MHHVENEKISKLIQIKQDNVLIEIRGEIDGSNRVRFKDTILPPPSVRLLAAMQLTSKKAEYLIAGRLIMFYCLSNG
jgi:hypothetical protein